MFFSFLLFSFTFMYLSPYLAVMGTLKGVVASGLAFWGLFLLTAPVLGRAAGGYICPLGGLQDSLHTGMEKPIARVRYLKVVKWAIWALWMLAIILAARASGGWRRFDLLFGNETGLPPYHAQAYVIMFGFMLATALPAMFLGQRGFCHYFCFFAPLNILGAKVGRALRLPMLPVAATGREDCKSCHLCDRGCPMSLPVQDMVRSGTLRHDECIACGACSTVCRPGATSYGFTRG